MLYVIFMFLLVGCEKTITDKSHRFELGLGLQDCKVYSLFSEHGESLTVVRCPNSSTTVKHSCGKNCNKTVSVIDNVENK
jgi:hypothetical protein